MYQSNCYPGVPFTNSKWFVKVNANSPSPSTFSHEVEKENRSKDKTDVQKSNSLGRKPRKNSAGRFPVFDGAHDLLVKVVTACEQAGC